MAHIRYIDKNRCPECLNPKNGCICDLLEEDEPKGKVSGSIVIPDECDKIIWIHATDCGRNEAR